MKTNDILKELMQEDDSYKENMRGLFAGMDEDAPQQGNDSREELCSECGHPKKKNSGDGLGSLEVY